MSLERYPREIPETPLPEQPFQRPEFHASDSVGVSIVTITHDRADTYLPETIDTVSQQRYIGPVGIQYEHIVINNASEDNTHDYLEGLVRSGRYPHLRVFHGEENAHIADRLNQAAQIAQFPDVMPLDDDDRLFPHSLQIIANHLSPKAYCPDYRSGASFGFANIIDADGKRTIPPIDFDGMQWSEDNAAFLAHLWNCNQVTNGTAIFHKDTIHHIGGWDNNLQASTDWGMWMKLVAASIPLKVIEGYVSEYRWHDQQGSARPDIESIWQRDGEYLQELILRRYAGQAILEELVLTDDMKQSA